LHSTAYFGKVLAMDAGELEAEWDLLTGLLPEGWREAARTHGALRRARGIKDAETLLRLILLHAAGLSLRQATTRARAAGVVTISDVALLKRLRGAEPWLRYLTQQLLQARPTGPGLPGRVHGRRLRVVDATDIAEPGATGSSWRVHYSLTLPSLACDFFKVTDVTEGETYKRFPVRRGDLILGDRGYSHRAGVAHVVDHGGDVLVRLVSTNFPVDQARTGKPLALLAALRTVRGRQPKEWAVTFTVGPRRYAARLCAIRKSAAAAAQARQRAVRVATKKQRQIQPATLEAMDYVFVLTTVSAAALDTAQILDLYRVRWQVELAFKRLKSLMHAGHVPKYHGASARAWIQAKLLCVLLIEHLQHAARFFSPWGFALARPQ